MHPAQYKKNNSHWLTIQLVFWTQVLLNTPIQTLHLCGLGYWISPTTSPLERHFNIRFSQWDSYIILIQMDIVCIGQMRFLEQYGTQTELEKEAVHSELHLYLALLMKASPILVWTWNFFLSSCFIGTGVDFSFLCQFKLFNSFHGCLSEFWWF